MIENPRLRLALAEHGRRIALALAVVGAALLVLAIWTAFTPPVDAVTEQTNAQSIETEVDHGALVRSADSPWDSGTELQNHPAYLLNASPVLDVTVETDAPTGATVVHSARLRLRVVRDGDVVWEDVESLAAEEYTVEDGTAATSAAIDVAALRERRAALQSEFAGVGTVESTIVADARYETDRYEGNLTATAPLSITDRAYWVDGDASARDDPSQTQTITREAPIDWSTVLGFVVLGLGAIGGAAAAASYRVEADIEWLRQELHRQRYDDWISDGDLPMGVGSEYVSLDSLKDVVDVGIDTNQRVVYDDRRNVFAVISGEVVYYYSKDGDWNRVAWSDETAGEEAPSFLEAFGMADEPPEVEAGPPPADADVGPFGSGEEPIADGDPAASNGPGASTGVDDADASDPEGPFGSGEPSDHEVGSGADDVPEEGSLGPAERPPEDRPFGGEGGEDGSE